ncbi:MAG: hypothetical protein JW779_11065 [Candidatus Thorarchaeota archaeon]|nr:hypothetical protein [Candidatus Thorarchaeota archaeon]
MRITRLMGLLLILLPLLLGVFITPPVWRAGTQDSAESKTVELSNGEKIQIAPDEYIEEYHLSDAPTQMSGTGDSLRANESGVRVDTFTDEPLYYNSAGSTTTTANLSVPIGEGWESYAVYTDVTSITENRTWVQNSGLDDSSSWTFLSHDEPSVFGPSYTNAMTSQWENNGHGAGDGCAYFYMDGYYYDLGGGLRGDWYDVGDKAYMVQDLTIDRGDVSKIGISLDYWGDVAWGIMTGFFELFVSIGDPDNGGTYLWNMPFDAFTDDLTWYSTGYIEIDISSVTLPNIPLWVGLRTTAFEWWRPDINPVGRMDNIVVYVTAKAAPSDINLQMNGVDVSDVIQGSNPIFGLGTAWYVPVVPWTEGAAYANFSWTPIPNPPDPDFNINIALDVDVYVFARKVNSLTVNDTELITLGDNFVVSNATSVSWETNYYLTIPGGYEDQFFFNLSIPLNRDITFVSEPAHRYTNLTSDWYFGNPGDGVVNISVYDMGLSDPNGFWMIRGTSPNMVTNLQVWDDTLSQWVQTKTFRANEDTRFRAVLPSFYEDDVVTFTIYDSNGNIWDTVTGTVDSSGFAVSTYVNLDAVTAEVGSWEVQAYVGDSISSPDVHNIGFYRRSFSIVHSTQLSIKYPIASRITWSINVTYGSIVFLQLRVNDTDNGDLLAGGMLTYTGGLGSGTANDLGTGEYSITLSTTLHTNGAYSMNLAWSKGYYDSLIDTFTVNIIYETEFLSPDAPGIDVASGNDAVLHVHFEDMLNQPIDGASIVCNWSQSYAITPEGSGDYVLSLDTSGMTLDLYPVLITISKDYYQTRSIILRVEVRELRASAIPSSSLLSLPVGYTTSFTITYTDTDLQAPITGAAGIIKCNWSDIHSSGDQNYTVTETTPGIYEVVIFSMDDDVLDSYDVLFTVERYGAQNQSFVVTVELRTHLTSLYLENSVEPTAYTGNITVNLVYYDVDADTGIVNGTTSGGYVELIITSPTLVSPTFYVYSISPEGLYVIHIPANQWGNIGTKTLNIEVNWIGVNLKYSNLTLSTPATITDAPTDIFIGESPVVTAFGENITFTIIYYDISALTGVVNGTGPFSGNVHIYIDVLTAGETITQADMTITEIDFVTNPGEYRITFNSTLLSGLGTVQLRLWFNWTDAALPYYQNQVIVIAVITSHRLTTVDRNPLPLTPFDEMVNLTFTYRDSLSGLAILNSSQLSVSVPGYPSFNIYYLGDISGIFVVEINTSVFIVGSHSFYLDIVWVGAPYYQNRTNVQIFITVRERYTDLTHGTYSPIQIGNTLNLNFTYRDLDDYTSIGMDGATLSLDGWLTGSYSVENIGNGIYTLHLDTTAFSNTGTFLVNVTIIYGGSRNCADASDVFYLTLTVRRTQLTSDLPELAPFLTNATIVVYYTDDTTDAGISGAAANASCSAAIDPLQYGVNYWVIDNMDGSYTIIIDTAALGNFGPYTIAITVTWNSGWPFYQQRVRNVNIEVSRRPVSLTVSKSPLNTPFLSNATFEITVTDQLDSFGITLVKNNLILTHGIGGTLITNNQYSIIGSNGVYTISINSQILTSILENEHPIFILFVWGDAIPYYSNASSTTEVSIITRYTQAVVLQTPPGYYYFNMSALLRYNDYLTGTGIIDATVTISCLNTTSFDYWFIDNSDGTYTVLIDTNTLSGLGRYYFRANFTYFGTPYYRNVTNVQFNLVVNPVSTTLSFTLPQGVTYYLGDMVYANISYFSIEFGTGIESATISTDWDTLYGTSSTISVLAPGIYQIAINTSGLNAQQYQFTVNASKYLHLSKSIQAEILIAAIPVEIELVFTPQNPMWGDSVQFQANITDARTGFPVIGAYVNFTLEFTTLVMSSVADGLYNCTLDTSTLTSGEFNIRIQSTLLNYETRQKDFQIRIEKVASKILASIDPQSAVDGQIVTLEVDYLIYSSSLSISTGTVTFSWIGGSGSISWSIIDGKYVGTFIVTGADVGSYQILVQASSPNYKSVSYLVTIEITEIQTELVPISESIVSVNYRDIAIITVYLNNTDLNQPVTGASMSFGVGTIVGDLIELPTPGYYNALVNTSELSVQEWTVSISSDKLGYTPASIQFTLDVQEIETEIVILTSGTVSGYYGQIVTFYFLFNDTHANLSIPGAITNYTLETLRGSLVDHGNGTYSLTLNTTVVVAGTVPHDITVSFRKDNYEYSSGLVKLLVLPIPTSIIGPVEATFPVYDNYSMLFSFRDTLNDEWITDGTATVVWEFGTALLTNLNNGSYMFGPAEANLTNSLQDRLNPYRVRISISRTNYSRTDIEVFLTIREISTQVIHIDPITPIYVGSLFYVNVTFYDTDHNLVILNPVITFTSDSAIDDGLARETSLDIDWGNGTYSIAFRAPNLAFYTLEIAFTKTDYVLGSISLDIYAKLSPEQEALVSTFQYSTIGILAIAALAALYFRVLSVPRLLRILRRMVSSLGRGVIPKPANVPIRRQMILSMMNEDLASISLVKTMDDISISTVDVAAMDVESLLDELAFVVGLTESDVDTLRRDLDQMRPSERAGFINEVLKQERARRAKELAEADLATKEGVPSEAVEERLSEDELLHLKERLMKMGIEETEADLMVEQAKNLTKAEIDALLDEIGGMEE